MSRKPQPMRTVSSTLLLTASTRALETPSSTALAIASLRRLALFDSSLISLVQLRQALLSHLSGFSAAAAPSGGLNTPRRSSLGRQALCRRLSSRAISASLPDCASSSRASPEARPARGTAAY